MWRPQPPKSPQPQDGRRSGRGPRRRATGLALLVSRALAASACGTEEVACSPSLAQGVALAGTRVAWGPPERRDADFEAIAAHDSSDPRAELVAKAKG